MGSATASLVSERLQALAQLNSAFGQPDGSLFFTFDGALYQSMGVNADDTLRVLNVNTGQITASLDPVDIYSAVRAAAGNPLPPPQPPSSASALGPHGPSMMSNMMGKVGMYSTFLNMGYQIKGVKTILNNIPKFGVALGSVTTFLSAYQAFRGVQSLYKNGFSIGGLLNLAGSAFGIATGVNTLVGTLQGSGLSVLTNPAGWAVAGAVISASFMHAGINDLITNGFSAKGLLTAGLGFVGTVGFTHVALVAMFGMASMGVAIAIAAVVALISVLWSLFHRPPPEQIAAQNLSQALRPIIWTPGPLTLVGVGTVALLMGWSKNQPPPAMATLTVPAYYLNQVLAANGIANVPLNSQTPSVIVEPGDGKVVIVSPSGTDAHGNPLVTLQSYNVAKNFQFVSSPQAPPQGSYIPFFRVVNGKLDKRPNPAVVKALTIQDKMLQAVLSGALNSQDAMNALNVAAAANKAGVNPAY